MNDIPPFFIAKLKDMRLPGPHSDAPEVPGWTRIMRDAPVPCYWTNDVVVYRDGKVEPLSSLQESP